MFFKKKGDDFSEYSNLIRNYLNKDEYDSALARYYKLRSTYDSLAEEKKQEYFSEFNSISNQLIIYMHIEELRNIMDYGELEMIREKLSHIKFLTNNTENFSNSFLNYVKEKYKDYFDKYKIKLIYKEITAKWNEIEKMQDEKHYDKALNLFPSLIRSYKKLGDYAIDTKDVIEEIDAKREELKLRLLETRAYSPVAKVDVRTLRKHIEKMGKMKNG